MTNTIASLGYDIRADQIREYFLKTLAAENINGDRALAARITHAAFRPNRKDWRSSSIRAEYDALVNEAIKP